MLRTSFINYVLSAYHISDTGLTGTGIAHYYSCSFRNTAVLFFLILMTLGVAISLALINEIWYKVMCQFQAETSRASMIYHFHTLLRSKSVKASLA